MEIKTAISRCLDELGLAINTRRTYSNGLDRFVDYLREKGIDDTQPAELLTMDHFVYFMPWLDKKFAKQTAGVYGAANKAFMEWLVIEKYLEPTYFDTLRYQKSALRSHKRHEDKLPRSPKKDEVSRMLAAVRLCEDASPIKERNIALIEFLASSGCRVSEVTALNVQDIDLENRTTIVTGKGSKERRVFISPSAAAALTEYWEARKSAMATDPAFGRHDRGAGHKRIKRMTTTTARNIVKDIAAIARIDPNKFSPHYFRHAFATYVLSETHDLALVQDLLGHKDPKSTRVYAKIHADDLQKAHREIFK